LYGLSTEDWDLIEVGGKQEKEDNRGEQPLATSDEY
jgi:hypothetical protein